MGEDKLTPRQRVRLESLAQAINSHMVVSIAQRGAPPSFGDLLARAEVIEAWLQRADGN